MGRRAATAAAVLLLVGGACSDGDGDGGSDPASAEVTEAFESSHALAEGVLAWWVDGDRGAAAGHATEEALDPLFDVEPPDEAVEVVSCDPDSGLPGAESCVVRGGGVSMVLTAVERDGAWRLVSTLVVE